MSDSHNQTPEISDMKKVLICDLDMTLIDSRRDICIALAHAITEVTGHPVTEADVSPHLGKGLMAMAQKMLPGLGEKGFWAVVKEFQRYFWDRCNIYTTVYPGVIDTLTTVREMGIPIGIASNKWTRIAARVCEMNKLTALLDHIQGAEDLPGKPDPAVVLKACEVLGADPAKSIFVGDNVVDIQAGRAAGCQTAAVTYGLSGRALLVEQKPDLLVDRFSDILPLILQEEKS